MAYNLTQPFQEQTPTYPAAMWRAEAHVTDDYFADLWGNVIGGLEMYVSFQNLHHQILVPHESAMLATPVTIGRYDRGMMFVNAEQKSRNKGVFPGVTFTLMELSGDKAFDVKQLRVSYPFSASNHHGPFELDYFQLRKRIGDPVLDIRERVVIDFNLTNAPNPREYRLHSDVFEALVVAFGPNGPAVQDTMENLEVPQLFFSWLEPRIGTTAIYAALGLAKPFFVPEDLNVKKNQPHHKTLISLSSLLNRNKIGKNGVNQMHFDDLIKRYS